MSEIKPWYPDLGKPKNFQDHINPALGDDPPLRVPDATEDTAPLRGTKDLSDDDSLEDVVADSYAPDADADADVDTPVSPDTRLPPE